jgi:hypothetical protein
MTLPDKTTKQPDGAQKLATPSISLPKGGGAIRGMGEKFAANPVTGKDSVANVAQSLKRDTAKEQIPYVCSE